MNVDFVRITSGIPPSKWPGFVRIGIRPLPQLIGVLRGCGGLSCYLDGSDLTLTTGIVYKDLPHPPSGYLTLPKTPSAPPSAPSPTDGAKYAFRSADGAHYNVLMPTLGMAGTPYARSVPSTTPLPPQYLPDPGLVFDTLLKRDEFVEHPRVFNTDARDWTKNAASSYLDLSPLYGSAQAQVDSVRRESRAVRLATFADDAGLRTCGTGKDGSGRLWEDVFADARLLFMPPSTAALLVLFCRNHNFVASRILAVNERATFADPAKMDLEARAAQDEEVFQRARLVNTAFFMQVILGDYVGAILGLTRDGLGWRLNPLEGEGNMVSAEFNLMYRWHATSSAQDTEWVDALFKGMFGGKSGGEVCGLVAIWVTVDEFKTGAVKLVMGAPKDVKEWSFNGLKRGHDGRFADEDLAKILLDATESPASAFKARGIPDALRVIEILGIMQSRSWGTCSLNEFRSFIGLRPYKTFEEWNPDPKIYMAAESLYHHIDNLELHVGLQAEEAKVPMPGSGLCPGYTISRAILADAVCLTRGDRFLTVDMTPFNLTSWGYQDCMYDKQDGSIGGIINKMLFRTLPDYYPAASAYALFPFIVPKRMKGFVSALPDSPVAKYDWTRPAGPPRARALPLSAQLVANGSGVNGSAKPEGRVQSLLGGVMPDVAAVDRVLYNDDAVAKQAWSIRTLTEQLIATRSIEHVGSKNKYLNVVRDVINVLPVAWIVNDIVGLPLKTEANPKGIYRPQEVVDMFRSVASYVYDEAPASRKFEVHEHAVRAAALIMRSAKENLSDSNGHSLSGFADSAIQSAIGRNERERPFLQTLWAASQGSSRDALAAGIFAELVPTAVLFSRAICQVVDYYLSDERRARFVDVLSRSQRPDAAFDAMIAEALDGLSFQNAASLNHGLMHPSLFIQAAFHILQPIFALISVQRASGLSGQLHRIMNAGDGDKVQYLDTNAEITSWPVSLIIEIC
ncbi:hypothetical protein EVJ58_g4902 [Rhodofomes roseus]|uniref:Heme peroxidase n=1 Tax=Rhodofomes roseus TaxID=34475 RepID=A0A4Y9YEQ6_9APHY|nr:hypothetical protein EVJ58_g4902 [Rhodofomes roseus]